MTATATAAEMAAQVALTDQYVSLAQSILGQFFQDLPAGTAGEEIRDLLLDLMPELLSEVLLQVAFDAVSYYETQRSKFPDLAPLPDLLEPTVEVDQESLEGSIRWSVSPLFEDTENGQELTLKNLSKVMDRLIREQETNTIFEEIARDNEPVGYFRVPEVDACAFCIMLASRGAVYESAETAGEVKDFHDWCRCEVGVLFPGTEYPEGYEPDELYKQYVNG